MCYGWLQEIKKDHNAKNYRKGRFCKVCNGKHVTTLHAYVRKKVDNIQCQCNSEASNERKGSEVTVKLRHGDSGENVETYALLDSYSQGTLIVGRLITRFSIKGRRTSIILKHSMMRLPVNCQ